MNEPWLGRFNSALRDVKARHEDDFSFATINNSKDPEQGVRQLVAHVLRSARKWCDPKIAVIRRRDAERLVPKHTRPWTPTAWKELRSLIVFRPRSVVEDNEQWVQPLACGAQTHEK